MKKWLRSLASLSLLLSLDLAAEGLMIDTRFDHEGYNLNDQAKAEGKKSYSVFKANRLRLLLSSKLNDQLSSKVRLNLLGSTEEKEGSLSKFIDYAFLTHQFTPEFYMSGGKVIAGLGGREALTNPGDYYFTSVAGAELLGRDHVAFWPVGAVLGGMFDDHKVELLVANTTGYEKVASSDTSKPSKPTQSRMMMGVTYSGSLLEKMIQPTISYHMDGESDNVKARSYLAIGSRFNLDSIEVDLDYLMHQRDFKDWTTISETKSTSSIVGSVRYKATEEFHAVAKMDFSTQESPDSITVASPTFHDVKTQLYGLAVEYYPSADLKLRYHLAAVQKTIDDSSKTDKSVETTFLAGLRFVHDFMK